MQSLEELLVAAATAEESSREVSEFRERVSELEVPEFLGLIDFWREYSITHQEIVKSSPEYQASHSPRYYACTAANERFQISKLRVSATNMITRISFGEKLMLMYEEYANNLKWSTGEGDLPRACADIISLEGREWKLFVLLYAYEEYLDYDDEIPVKSAEDLLLASLRRNIPSDI